MKERSFFVYILCNRPRGTLYVGVTNDIARRVWEHRSKVAEGFTKKYGLGRLVWYESHVTAEYAIAREKQLKRWRRQWKIEWIERSNLDWIDLYDSLMI